MTWFSVVKYKFCAFEPGTIVKVEKGTEDWVKATPVTDFDLNGENIAYDEANSVWFKTVEAKEFLIKPTKDFDSVVEDSFLICEVS